MLNNILENLLLLVKLVSICWIIFFLLTQNNFVMGGIRSMLYTNLMKFNATLETTEYPSTICREMQPYKGHKHKSDWQIFSLTQFTQLSSMYRSKMYIIYLISPLAQMSSISVQHDWFEINGHEIVESKFKMSWLNFFIIFFNKIFIQI